eukprot:7852480-Pyramimonas_sp.AAC.1
MTAMAAAARQLSAIVQGERSIRGRIRNSSSAPGAQQRAQRAMPQGAAAQACRANTAREKITAAGLAATAWHSMQGVCVGVGDLALSPANNSHAAEHLRRALDIPNAEGEFYVASLPTWNEESNGRT